MVNLVNLYVYTQDTVALSTKDATVRYKRVVTESYLKTLKEKVIVVNRSIDVTTLDIIKQNNKVYINNKCLDGINTDLEGIVVYKDIDELALSLTLTLGINVLTKTYNGINNIGNISNTNNVINNNDSSIDIGIKAELDNLKQDLLNKNSELEVLTTKLSNKEKELDITLTNLTVIETELANLKVTLSEKESEINNLSSLASGSNEANNKELEDLKQYLSKKESEYEELRVTLKTTKEELTILKSSLEAKDSSLDNVNTEIDNLKNVIEGQEVTIKNLREVEIHNLTEQLSAKENELKDLLDKVNKANDNKDLTDNILSDLQEQLKTKDLELKEKVTELENLKDLLSSKESEVVDLQNKLQDVITAQEQLSTKEIDYNILLENFKQKETELLELKDKVQDVVNLQEQLSVKETEYTELKDNFKQKEIELLELQGSLTELDELRSQLALKENEYNELSNLFKDKELEIVDLTNKVDSLNESKNNNESEQLNLLKQKEYELSEVTSKLHVTETELVKLKNRISSFTNDLIAKDVEITTLQTKVGDLDVKLNELNTVINTKNSNIESLQNTISSLEMKLKVGSSSIQKVTDLENELQAKDLEITQLNTRIESLINSEGSIQDINIKYTQKGKIINIYGLSSMGITAMTYTLGSFLASKGKKVIAVDLDIFAPKLDSYLSVIPFNKDLVYGSSFEKTALNELRVKGSVLDLGKLIIKTKSGVDYLAGLYINNTTGIDKIDYTKLFNQLGTLYDYILVDNGKILNTLQLKLVEAVSRVSYKNLIMVDNSKSTEFNLLLIKIGKLKDLINNLYVLNNSITTIVSDRTKAVTKDKHYLFIRDKSTGGKVFTNNMETLERIISEVE